MIIALKPNSTETLTFPQDKASPEKQTRFIIKSCISKADRDFVQDSCSRIDRTIDEEGKTKGKIIMDIARRRTLTVLRGLVRIERIQDAAGNPIDIEPITDQVMDILPDEITDWLAGEIQDRSQIASFVAENFPSPSGA